MDVINANRITIKWSGSWPFTKICLEAICFVFIVFIEDNLPTKKYDTSLIYCEQTLETKTTVPLSDGSELAV